MISHCYRVKKNVLTPRFLIIIWEEECRNNFEEDEAFPPMVLRPEDMTDQEVMGFNDDDVLLLTRNDHTPSPRAPYAKLGLHLIQTKACQSI